MDRLILFVWDSAQISEHYSTSLFCRDTYGKRTASSSDSLEQCKTCSTFLATGLCFWTKRKRLQALLKHKSASLRASEGNSFTPRFGRGVLVTEAGNFKRQLVVVHDWTSPRNVGGWERAAWNVSSCDAEPGETECFRESCQRAITWSHSPIIAHIAQSAQIVN